MVTTLSRGATVTDRRNLRTPDVLDLTRATYRQLDWWCRTYDICADPTPGSGQARTFTVTEARVVRALVLAGAHGVNVGTYARGIAAALSAQPEASHIVLADGAASAHLDMARACVAMTRLNCPATVVPVRFAK